MRPSLVISSFATIALVVTGCSSSGGGETTTASPGASGGKVTLTLATFNEFGYEELVKEYMAANPNVTIQMKKAATSNEARDNMNTRLAAGSGLSDIEAIEVDWLPELLQYPDKFVDLKSDAVSGRWLDWKAAQATTADGKLIGYGTDIGPQAVCYRADLFKAAGLPTERTAVAALLGNTLDSYLAAGRQFKAKSKVPWMESSGALFNAMVNQVKNAYEKDDGTIIATENPEVKALYDKVLAASAEGLTARLAQWSDDWTGSFQRNGFATMICPGWMLGVIKGNAAKVNGWDIADTFPGGGGNWGGSFLTVPSQSKHPQEAKALAEWLTAPEQQIKAFVSKGTFPSQTAALEDPKLLSSKNAFFNNAPVGQILANRAKAVEVVPFKGPKYSGINDAMQAAISRVDIDRTDTPAQSWDKFVTAVKALS
ncbi:MAG: extracellular solute-binding protein [Austwickia sp.]|nr:extracellular solute-binding protein [Austwickia sp.]MBK8436541.1 extracellular solute-binding protein [Austwickia sp.]MBK9102219.1 extracellular solute-binding protein [Austwickia sp.]